jgi:hypothetical protein
MLLVKKQGTQSTYKKIAAFLYTSSEQAEKKMRKIILI